MSNEIHTEQMRKLAEVGAALCCYAPGAGNPEAWPTSRCDCKFLPALFSVLKEEYHQLGSFKDEMTGCCEVRQAWLALKALSDGR